jgi:predicted acyltransferase
VKTATAPAPTATESAQRIESLDALRGFDMFWIVGADALGHAFTVMKNGPVTEFLARQLEHAEWEGFYFYDLIFPLFVFVLGVSAALSVSRMVARNGRAGAMQRIIRRGIILYLLGILYYGGISEGVDHIRLLGVLQRLAICYVVAATLLVYVRPRVIAGIMVALLVVYWALMTWVPVPGFGAGDFAHGHNLANWIDVHYLPLKLWYGDYDPEGLLSTLPAIASCLLGVFAGRLLQDPTRTPARKVQLLIGGGAVLIGLGYLWGIQFPVIKRIWTSSFVLLAGGWSAVLLGVFYFVIDIVGWRVWARPFVWVGANALTIYFVSRLVDFNAVSRWLFGGEIAQSLENWLPGLSLLVLALTGCTLCILFCRFLYVRKIFLRL